MNQVSLDYFTAKRISSELGTIKLQDSIKTTIGPFQYLPAYKIQYPEVVIKTLISLFAEYNHSFASLVKANREWDNDYQYCMTGPNGSPINYFVQIDMVGLPDEYLKRVATLEEKDVREDLRGAIFEIENSVAIYQILSGIFSQKNKMSFFRKRFRESLNKLKQQINMPIALVALTEQKYQAMKEIEFGKKPNESITNEEVLNLSGFDTFFGPKELTTYLRQNESKYNYSFYVRASNPLAKLRDPNLVISNSILADECLRKRIKTNAITFNIDNPAWAFESERRINDTKAYLPLMNMANPIYSNADIQVLNVKLHTANKSINSEKVIMRAKPMKDSYGCYGHERGLIENSEFRRRLRKNLRLRGPYVIQPEKHTPLIINTTDGKEYTYIDRNFFSTDGSAYKFLGGFRLLMPINSTEAQRGKIHNTGITVWAEIYENDSPI